MRLGQSPEPFRGNANVRWDQSDWFTSLLTLESKSGGTLNLEYRGRVPVTAERYTFVLQHGELGRVEGEGWITPQAIMQRFWVLNDPQKRTGVEKLLFKLHRIATATPVAWFRGYAWSAVWRGSLSEPEGRSGLNKGYIS
ncbi:MAG: hypothetical protein HC926_00025 [Synechococcaceae cyanobacterium SM2_3_60]|nr:hypothetical protein [Synechococcaceae cyanobacterium SM2_3_60]